MAYKEDIIFKSIKKKYVLLFIYTTQLPHM